MQDSVNDQGMQFWLDFEITSRLCTIVDSGANKKICTICTNHKFAETKPLIDFSQPKLYILRVLVPTFFVFSFVFEGEIHWCQPLRCWRNTKRLRFQAEIMRASKFSAMQMPFETTVLDHKNKTVAASQIFFSNYGRQSPKFIVVIIILH